MLAVDERVDARGLLSFNEGLLEAVEGVELAVDAAAADVVVVVGGGIDSAGEGGTFPFEISFLLDLRFEENIGMMNSILKIEISRVHYYSNRVSVLCDERTC